MGFTVISGPRDSGPGEREVMFETANLVFDQAGIVDHQRIDVPDRGAGESSEGQLRESVQAIVPALQSGSLFGDSDGVFVVDAQNLLKGEATVVAGSAGSATSSFFSGTFNTGSTPIVVSLQTPTPS